VTPGLRNVLIKMRDAEDREDWYEAEIVADGIYAYLGDDRISWRTINQGLRLLCFTDTGEQEKGCRRFAINGTGRVLIDHPEDEDIILRALLGEGNITTRNGRIVWLDT
jgi:hypothetical protein